MSKKQKNKASAENPELTGESLELIENSKVSDTIEMQKPEAQPLFKIGEILANAEFLESKVVVWSKDEGNRIYSEKYFGKWIDEEKVTYLQLSLEEAMLLIDRGHIKINYEGKPITSQVFYEKCMIVDKEFPQKFTVYRDLRNRGYIVKSGFKFGTHFRVYDRGVNPYKEGSKETKEHTKYNVHAYSENHMLMPQEWSRYVRLSHNIRATALMAIVDEEGDVTYYKIIRTKP
ncbi:MAG: tRNA-intron lyase [Nanoarchaeota archaeon]|nr:tRNA-intron lyase [Nanoarchaeota archaeon]MBU4300864.1 tRNA-intron lyase [Nanoarchaeota archaeon]MBU4451430.1 tRNA-intron lyase [Nanoarchaeota archaeon]MCG2724496.1 tRNA-intron lyase [archaeon]